MNATGGLESPGQITKFYSRKGALRFSADRSTVEMRHFRAAIELGMGVLGRSQVSGGPMASKPV